MVSAHLPWQRTPDRSGGGDHRWRLGDRPGGGGGLRPRGCERELLVLANVDSELCTQVAAGLGLPVPR